MTAPEPVDQKTAVPVEIRGGDRDEDFMPAALPPYAEDECVSGQCTCHDWTEDE